MFKTISATVLLLFATAIPVAHGQEYSVGVLNEGPDAGEVSAELVALMSEQGMQVKRGSRTAAEVWFCKEWSLDDTFVGSSERLYPFTPGQLIGVIHLNRRGSDFRQQQISSGWYTLRFGLQPVDGNHEGTSPTRDFLLLVDASKDAADKEWDIDDLYQVSAEAAGSTHPAMICLQPSDKAPESPSIRHDDFHDWWILQASGKGVGADKQTKPLGVDMVVEGYAAE